MHILCRSIFQTWFKFIGDYIGDHIFVAVLDMVFKFNLRIGLFWIIDAYPV